MLPRRQTDIRIPPPLLESGFAGPPIPSSLYAESCQGKERSMAEMREFYEDRFSKKDPYDLHQIREAEIINDYKIDLLHRIFPPPSTYERSLDIGCGDVGIFVSHPQCKGTEFSISLDLSFNAARRCREHHMDSQTKMYFVVANAEDLPFADDTFDFVYCSEVLEHLLVAEKGRDEIYHVLHPEGEAVVSVPNEKEYILCPGEHLSNFTYDSFKSFITERFEIRLEKGLYLNEIYPWDLIRTRNAEPRFQELLRLGESRPEESFAVIFKVQPLGGKSELPRGLPLGESVCAYISPEELASRAKILFLYQIKSKKPLFGPLITWVRRNLTSHLKEPYIDQMAGRQTSFNLLVVRCLRKIGQSLDSSLTRNAEEIRSVRERQGELERQLDEIRRAIDRSNEELKGEIKALKGLLERRSGEDSGVER